MKKKTFGALMLGLAASGLTMTASASGNYDAKAKAKKAKAKVEKMAEGKCVSKSCHSDFHTTCAGKPMFQKDDKTKPLDKETCLNGTGGKGEWVSAKK